MENVAARFLEDIPEADIIESLIYNYRRRLAIYKLTDKKMNKKYGISFDEFVSQRVVREKEYSWNVESDAMEWETAISGIKTMERKIKNMKCEH